MSPQFFHDCHVSRPLPLPSTVHQDSNIINISIDSNHFVHGHDCFVICQIMVHQEPETPHRFDIVKSYSSQTRAGDFRRKFVFAPRWTYSIQTDEHSPIDVNLYGHTHGHTHFGESTNEKFRTIRLSIILIIIIIITINKSFGREAAAIGRDFTLIPHVRSFSTEECLSKQGERSVLS